MKYGFNDQKMEVLENTIYVMMFENLWGAKRKHPFNDQTYFSADPVPMMGWVAKQENHLQLRARLLAVNINGLSIFEIHRELERLDSLCHKIKLHCLALKAELEALLKLPSMAGFMNQAPCANYDVLALFICKRQMGLTRSIINHKPSRNEVNFAFIQGYYPFAICALIGPDRILMPAIESIKALIINREPALELKAEAMHIRGRIHDLTGRILEQRFEQPPAKTIPNAAPGQERAIFPKLEGLKWEEITLQLKDRETVIVKARSYKQVVNFAELGFKDRRTGKPDTLWDILFSCFQDGHIDWPRFNLMRRHGEAKTIIHRIRKRLQNFTQLKDNPFYPYLKSQQNYQVRFQLITKSEMY